MVRKSYIITILHLHRSYWDNIRRGYANHTSSLVILYPSWSYWDNIRRRYANHTSSLRTLHLDRSYWDNISRRYANHTSYLKWYCISFIHIVTLRSGTQIMHPISLTILYLIHSYCPITRYKMQIRHHISSTIPLIHTLSQHLPVIPHK